MPSFNVTLEDGAWKDTFDRIFISGPGRILKTNNKVRASFNIDSSVENLKDTCDELVTRRSILKTNKNIRPSFNTDSSGENLSGYLRKGENTISTPITHAQKKPFVCTLSPITSWKLKIFNNTPFDNFLGGKKNEQAIEIPKRQFEKVYGKRNNIKITKSPKDLVLHTVKSGLAKGSNVKFVEKGMKKNKGKRSKATVIKNFKDIQPKDVQPMENSLEQRNNADIIVEKSNELFQDKNDQHTKGDVEIDEKPKNIAVDPKENNHKTRRTVKIIENSKDKIVQHVESRLDHINSEENDIEKSKDLTRAEKHPDKKRSVKINENTKDIEAGLIGKNRKIRTIKIMENYKDNIVSPISKRTRNKLTKSKVRSSSNVQEQLVKGRDLDCMLLPGKWRKSLLIWRRNHAIQVQDFFKVGNRKSIVGLLETRNSQRKSSKKSIHSEARKKILKRCAQKIPLDFLTIYPESSMEKCKKIGEGAYGEVFFNINNRGSVVLKIIPIEGDINMNGEIQKTFEEVLSEITISMEMSNLRYSEIFKTDCFVEVQRIACVRGKYPTHLLNLWEIYDVEHGSENENPSKLPSDQLYIVLELSYGGKSLETFTFEDAEQSYSALVQTTFALAIAEQSFQFEHRDLHLGNVLIDITAEKNIEFQINSNPYYIPAKGIKVTIIDYTLSRMTFDNCDLYNDLANDEDLFTATGDQQYETYRMMRTALENKWNVFLPKTNILWLFYIATKMFNGINYKRKRTKKHISFINKLKDLSQTIMNFDSAYQLAVYLGQSIEK